MYTWSNKHADVSVTKERLDTAVANNLWKELYKEVRIEGLPAVSSDHKPLLVSFKRGFNSQYRIRKVFRFETKWIKEGECANIIEKEWNFGILPNLPLKRVHTTLNKCSSSLFKWNKQRSICSEKVLNEKYELFSRLQATEGP